MAAARYYVGTDPEKSFPGVPLADLDQDTWDALPDHIKANVDASDLYRKTKPRDEPAHAAPVKADDKKGES